MIIITLVLGGGYFFAGEHIWDGAEHSTILMVSLILIQQYFYLS